MLHTAKPVLKSKFIALCAYIGSQESSQINNGSFNIKKLEEYDNSKVYTKKEIIKIRVSISI